MEGPLRHKTLTLLVAVLAAFTLVAQEAKKDEKKAAPKSAILHPELTVENGTFDKPMATLGTKPAEPWTATTVAAGVDKKPQPGRAVTIKGEIVDFS